MDSELCGIYGGAVALRENMKRPQGVDDSDAILPIE